MHKSLATSSKPLAAHVAFAFAALAAAGAPAAVHAQSSVTLYGIIDEGVNYTSNVQTSPGQGHSQYSLSSGILSGSRWGLRGNEDLGGGMKAIFVLESGFDVNNGKMGQGSLLFGRQAYVGVSNPYGTVTLGRQYDPVVDYIHPLMPSAMFSGSIGAHPGDLDNINNSNRVNNAIKYTSSNYGGFTFGGVYSLGGVAGNISQNQIWSLGGSYYNGPLGLGVGYLNIRNPNTSFYGTSALANTTGSAPLASLNNIASPVFSGFANARTQEVYAAGGAYTYGAATFGGTYSNTRFDDLNGGGSGPNPFGNRGTAMFNNVEVNVKYQITPAFLVGVAYDYTKGSSVSGRDGATYHQAQAGADYFLSKRTDVYLVGAYQHASGQTRDATGTAVVNAQASVGSYGYAGTSSQELVAVGLRHLPS